MLKIYLKIPLYRKDFMNSFEIFYDYKNNFSIQFTSEKTFFCSFMMFFELAGQLKILLASIASIAVNR